MSSLDMLNRQHREVREAFATIDGLLKKDDIESTARDIAKAINLLAGKLKMHLMSEDKFLYPELKESPKINVREIAENFSHEMGGVADEYASFVKKYNIASKIVGESADFRTDYTNIKRLVLDRIDREDKHLYILLK